MGPNFAASIDPYCLVFTACDRVLKNVGGWVTV